MMNNNVVRDIQKSQERTIMIYVMKSKKVLAELATWDRVLEISFKT
jgi:hypothetical protein